MRYFLDFEATQFSQKIISIGCIADNGATFSSFVNPKTKDKITKFITRLTGITKEMIANAPDADTVFNQLFDFICENSDGEAPTYYCYGNSDKTFLENTIKVMTNPRAIMCAEAIKSMLVDYSLEVQKYFVCSYAISLKKVYSLVKDEMVIQKHDALEDAEMLQFVVRSMKSNCSPEDKVKFETMPGVDRSIYPEKKKAPAMFIAWTGHSNWNADTRADETDWKYKCVNENNNKVKYFNNLETAALWLIKYYDRKRSPKKQENIDYLTKKIELTIEKNKPYFGMIWERND